MNSLNDVEAIAAEMDAEIRALPVRNTPGVRAIRRKYSRALKGTDATLVLGVARELIGRYGYRGVAYELVLFRHVLCVWQ
jgi:hypothetical protein